MRREVNVKVVDVSHHRNGVGGMGFYAVLFDDAENGRMVASLFDEPGYCAVYSVEELAKGNIAFARGNSWRGDVYEDALRPLIKAHLKQAALAKARATADVSVDAQENVGAK